jgi:hypothetical protein
MRGRAGGSISENLLPVRSFERRPLSRCSILRPCGKRFSAPRGVFFVASEFVLTLRQKMPIVRPPFGKSIDFLEPIPSNFRFFLKVDPRPVSRPRSSCQQTGNPCRSHRQGCSDPFRKGFLPMKRLSLLAVALTLLVTSSGCCCGLFHGCGGCGYPPSCGSCGYAPACGSCGGGCGYAPAYGAPAPCSTCPTCPGGGCGVQGPVIQQGAFYEGGFGTAISQASPTPASPTVAANDHAAY